MGFSPKEAHRSDHVTSVAKGNVFPHCTERLLLLLIFDCGKLEEGVVMVRTISFAGRIHPHLHVLQAGKGTSIKDALTKWVRFTRTIRGVWGTLIIVAICVFAQAAKMEQDPKTATEVQLYMQLPPIEKMDASLSTLAACE